MRSYLKIIDGSHIEHSTLHIRLVVLYWRQRNGRRKKVPSGFEGKGDDEILGATQFFHTNTVSDNGRKWSQSSQSFLHSLRLLTTTTTTTTTTGTMQASTANSSNDEAIVSPDAAMSDPSGGPPGQEEEEQRQRNTKRRRVTTEGARVVEPPTPLAPSASPAPMTVRSVKQIIVDDLRSNDEGTLVKALEDLWLVHLDSKRDDFQDMKDEFIKYGGHLAVSRMLEGFSCYSG
jgi:hypothetical protein